MSEPLLNAFPGEIIGKQITRIEVVNSDIILIIYFSDNTHLEILQDIDCCEDTYSDPDNDYSSLIGEVIIDVSIKGFRQECSDDDYNDNELYAIFYEILTDKSGSTVLTFRAENNGIYTNTVCMRLKENSKENNEEEIYPLRDVIEFIRVIGTFGANESKREQMNVEYLMLKESDDLKKLYGGFKINNSPIYFELKGVPVHTNMSLCDESDYKEAHQYLPRTLDEHIVLRKEIEDNFKNSM